VPVIYTQKMLGFFFKDLPSSRWEDLL